MARLTKAQVNDALRSFYEDIRFMSEQRYNPKFIMRYRKLIIETGIDTIHSKETPQWYDHCLFLHPVDANYIRRNLSI